MLNKAKAEEFVSKLKAAGINQFSVTSTSANIRFHHGDSSQITFDDDGAWCIAYCNDITLGEGIYDIYFMPYDMVETINSVGIDFQTGQKLISDFSLNVEDEFVKNTPIKRDPFIKKSGSTASISAMKDEDGNYVIPKGSSGYVV